MPRAHGRQGLEARDVTPSPRATQGDALRAERKALEAIDRGYNPEISTPEIEELATLKFLDARKDILLLGKPDSTGKSHVAKALAIHKVL